MVALAVGTQTNGSIIRPASYCGVYGFKPSFGRISRHAVLKQSPPLDTVGVFARSLDDLALIADVLMRYDAQDSAMIPIAPPRIGKVLAQEVPADQHFAFVRSPVWEQVEQVTKDGLRELIDAVNASRQKTVDIVDLPAPFAGLHEDHRRVMEADLARNFAAEYDTGKIELSAVLREMIERGQQVSDSEYDDALAKMQDYDLLLEEIFDEYDAILTPATPGPALLRHACDQRPALAKPRGLADRRPAGGRERRRCAPVSQHAMAARYTERLNFPILIRLTDRERHG
jgi:Asp-tRNA(Asn)/Glu-tRNA(Gln) amidotransferase A subunit family amidase